MKDSKEKTKKDIEFMQLAINEAKRAKLEVSNSHYGYLSHKHEATHYKDTEKN